MCCNGDNAKKWKYVETRYNTDNIQNAVYHKCII